MMGGQQPKGDIRTLWKAIGVTALGDTGVGREVTPDLVWQNYNPYPQLARLAGLGPELVFVRQEQPRTPEANPGFRADDPVVSNLEEVLFPFPGGVIRHASAEGIEFVELVRTGNLASGQVSIRDLMEHRGDPGEMQRLRGLPTGKQYVLAAQLLGKAPVNKARTDLPAAEGALEPRPINVIYVADIDCLDSQFVSMRANPENPMFADIRFNFDNVSFVLNLIDRLAGDDRFLEIRTRKFSHPTLQAVEMQVESARSRMEEEILRFREEYRERAAEADKAREEAVKKINDEITQMQQTARAGGQVDFNRLNQLREEAQLRDRVEAEKAAAQKRNLEQEMVRKIERIELDNELQVQRIQNWFKLWAVLLPPIPPLLLGLVVFARRRIMEREGISKTRMR
jgi:ABC-2 type transport system permease protein